MVNKKQNIIFVLKYIVIFVFAWCFLYSVFYLYRSNKTFKKFIDKTKSSSVLKNELGEIKDVKLNNYFKWMQQKQGHNCVDMIIITNDKKYKICTIIENDIEGYIINDKIIYESK